MPTGHPEPSAGAPDPAAGVRLTHRGMPYSRARHFDRILSRRAVTPVYQPIVHLASGEVVAFEALARGPSGSPLERPDLLFGTARDLGLVGELDWICRASAMGGALERGLGGGLTLFVNVEPDVAATRAPDDLFQILKSAEQRLRVVLEVTERALLDRPPELLHWLSWARDRWWGVALDDVGATAESLALMPFVKPDVIKLDNRFLRQPSLTDADQRVLAAVRAHAAGTGATILVEGVERSADLDRAAAIGATLAQGWYFGRPAALPRATPAPRHAVPLLDIARVDPGRTAWEALQGYADDRQRLPVQQVRRVLGRVLEGALRSPEAPLVLAAVPPAPGPWAGWPEQLRQLVGRVAYVGVVGAAVERSHAPGWQTAPLQPDDEMADEWVIAVVGPHHAQVAAAWDTGERDADGRPLLEVLTSDRADAATAVADLLMRAIALPAVDVDGRPLPLPPAVDGAPA